MFSTPQKLKSAAVTGTGLSQALNVEVIRKGGFNTAAEQQEGCSSLVNKLLEDSKEEEVNEGSASHTT